MPDATLLGRVKHVGDVAGLSSYEGTLVVSLPGLLQGSYYVIVVADSGMAVPDVNRANNVAASSTPLSLAPPLLSLGTAVSGTISNGQELFYRLNVTPGSNVQLEATFGVADESELLVRYGTLPTASSFDESNTADLNALQPQLVLPSGQGGTYYILLDGRDGAGAGESFTLLASMIPFEVSSFSTASGNNTGPVSMTITGSGFTDNTTVSLLDGGTTIVAESTTLINANQLNVTFDLTGQAAGNYSVKAVDGSQSAVAPGTFQVTAQAASSNLQVYADSPPGGLVGMPFYLSAGVINEGNTDIQIPEFELIGTNVNGVSQEVIGFGGGVLAPKQVATPMEPNNQTPGVGGLVKFLPYPDTVGTITTWTVEEVPPSTSIDWSSLPRPTDIPAAAWSTILANLSAAVGTTFADLDSVFQADSIYLAQVGDSVTDQSTLLDFELGKANDSEPTPILSSVVDSDFAGPGLPLEFQRSFVQSITGRYTSGLLGFGWATNWDMSATTDNSGDVYIQEGANDSEFTLDSNGTYVSDDGDPGTLTFAHGAFTLTEPSGTVTSFLPDGQFNSIQDSSGNSITAGYNSANQLTTLTQSDGEVMTLSYNAQGLLSQVTDPAGNVTTYTYDANDQLVGVSGPNGSYAYTYINGQGAAEEHALASITNPNGTQLNFTYDSQGRLTKQSGSGATGTITYAYLSPGGYTSTDLSGATTKVLYNAEGAPAVITDALGNVTSVTYNADGEPVLISSPGGTASSATYNADGSIASETDALGNTTQFTENPATGALQSLEDANGNTTSYSYTSQGLLSSILQANGNTSDYFYNAQGEISKTINALGLTTRYAYNSAGDLTSQINPDGTTDTYTYDAQGDVLSATDASGTTALIYNSARDLTQITYPNGQFLTYTYNAGNQLTQLVDQSGFAENYTYYPTGQLMEVTDAAGAMVASYTYNSANQLTSLVHGNGTYTTYAYDADGNLLHLINFAPGGSINSRFDYTYDALNDVATMTTLAGTTTYGYDADGQLTSATLPTGEKITYAYDAAGNRTVVSDTGGTTTNYVTNDVNEYTTVGGYTYSYDADGNLTVTGGPAGNTIYTYDDENRLIEVQTPTDTETYKYDALGNLISSTDNGKTTQYLVDPTGLGNVVAEYDGSGNLIANFTYGKGLVSQVNASGVASYYDFDATGSTAGLSGSTGSYLASYSYLPFGVLQSSTGSVNNPFQFNGQAGVMTQTNGLDFMRARFYSPTIGRFINPDPSGLAGGLNEYTFVSNNPLVYEDPSGLLGFGLNPNTYSTGIGLEQRVVQNETPTLLTLFYENVVQPAAALIDSGGALSLGGATVAALAVLDVYLFYRFVHDGYALYKEVNVPVVNGADLATTTTIVVGPHDPNYVTGPAGFGTQGFVQAGATLPYTIGFENEASATAPAHVVEVTEQIDPNLDWNTFQLGEFGFGGQVFAVPAGLTSYSTQINDVTTLGVYVDVDAEFDELNGELTWTFTTIDPTTLDDPVGNAFEGFLPPNVTPPQGQGFISYTVQPNAADPTGTVINAQGTVIFDAGLSDQSSLETPSTSNTIDSGPPVSTVGPLPPTESSPNFTVTWSGQDDAGGSGIASYDIYASTDGGPFLPWLINTTLTSAVYAGAMDNYYSFYSVATDNVGNVQPTPLTAQATTSLGVIFTGKDSTNFNDPNNWNTGFVPTSADAAYINSGTVVVSSGLNVGNLYIVGGTLDWTGGALDSDLTIDPGAMLQINGSGPMTISGATLANGGTIDQATAAVTIVRSTFANTGLVEINAGTFSVVGNITGSGVLSIGTSTTTADVLLGSGGGVSTLSALTIAAGSRLDITDNTLQLNYGVGATDPVATIRGYLVTGYNGDTWTGAGIMSSTAAGDPGVYSIGYADGSVDSGTLAQPGQILLKLTLAGDANLDGTVNFGDLLSVSQNFNKTNRDWAQGDFNYDGIVNFADLLLVSQNFNKQLAAVEASQAVNLTAPIDYVRLDADGLHTDIWTNATASGPPAQSILLADIPSLTYAGPAGADQLIIDFTNGDPLPASGLTFNGGAGTNTLEVIGTSGNDTATVNGSTIVVATPLGASSIPYTAASTIIFDGNAAGANTLSQTAQPGGGASLVFSQPTALDTLNVDGGMFTVPADAPGGGSLDYTLGTVSIAWGAKLVLAASDVPADQTILAVNNLTVAGALDLTDNVLEINYTPGNDPLAAIQGYLKTAYNNDTWTGPGITSSNAAADPSLYAVGYTDGNLDAGTPAAPNQIYIKNTLAGDANLDGTINFADLLAVSQNFNKTNEDWAHGDFNYDGTVNFADLLLVSQNFNKQLASGQLAQIPDSTGAAAQIVAPTTTPAPAARMKSSTPVIAAVLTVFQSHSMASVAAISPTRHHMAKPTASARAVADGRNVNIRPAAARLVVATPPALPTDGITEDALVGVWNVVSTEDNLIFADARQTAQRTH
jgi:RHS repeat-associated protein